MVSVAVQSAAGCAGCCWRAADARTPELVDLRQRNPANWLAQPFWTLFSNRRAVVRVVAKPRFRDGDFVEIVVPNGPLRRELTGYLMGLVWVAAFVAVVIGLLLFWP